MTSANFRAQRTERPGSIQAPSTNRLPQYCQLFCSVARGPSDPISAFADTGIRETRTTQLAIAETLLQRRHQHALRARLARPTTVSRGALADDQADRTYHGFAHVPIIGSAEAICDAWRAPCGFRRMRERVQRLASSLRTRPRDAGPRRQSSRGLAPPPQLAARYGIKRDSGKPRGQNLRSPTTRDARGPWSRRVDGASCKHRNVQAANHLRCCALLALNPSCWVTDVRLADPQNGCLSNRDTSLQKE